jgi:EmrB/QacA subfamily drug resistance transporter
VFPALALGTLMATLDISIVNIALPVLSRTFHAPLTTVEWVVIAYVITIAGLLLTLGRLADRVGRRTVYGMGLAVFTVASALCAMSPGVGWLIAARAIQGFGAAMMTANSAALLITNFPPEERGKALGAFGAMVGVGLALGPPLGGLLVDHFSWRWIFLVNLPLGLLAQWQLRARVPADAPATSVAPLSKASAALWCSLLVSVMLVLSRGPANGWLAVWPYYLIAAFSLFAFVMAERASAEPLLPFDLLRGPLGITATLTLIGQALSIAVGFHLPLYFVEVLGFREAKAGQWLAVLPLAALFMAPAAGRWSDRIGPRVLSVAGLAIAAIGFALLAQLGVTPHPGHILGGMALIGAGLGLFTVPNSSALLSTVPADRLGVASGLQATMRNLGISGGAAGTAAVVASRYRDHGGGTLTAGAALAGFNREAFARATHDVYLAMAGLALLALALAWWKTPRATTPRPVPDMS